MIDETSRIYRNNNELHMITGEIDHKDLINSNLTYLFHIEHTKNAKNDENGEFFNFLKILILFLKSTNKNFLLEHL